MSRLPGKTLARRIPAAIAGTAAVVALTAGSAMISAGTAAAEPVIPEGIAALIAQAAAISPEASAAVQQLIGTAGADQITTASISRTSASPSRSRSCTPHRRSGVAWPVNPSPSPSAPHRPVRTSRCRRGSRPTISVSRQSRVTSHTQDLRVECCLDQRRHVQGRHRPVGREVARTRYAVALEGRRHR